MAGGRFLGRGKPNVKYPRLVNDPLIPTDVDVCVANGVGTASVGSSGTRTDTCAADGVGHATITNATSAVPFVGHTQGFSDLLVNGASLSSLVLPVLGTSALLSDGRSEANLHTFT